MWVASIAVEELLLVLKIAFIVLLYLFIWRIVRTASKDLRLPQESFILAPQTSRDQDVDPRAGSARVDAGRLVVVSSPTLRKGEEHELDSKPLTFGRGPQNDITLSGDDYAVVDSNLGSGAGNPLGAQFFAVPEPGSAMVIIIGAAAMIFLESAVAISGIPPI